MSFIKSRSFHIEAIKCSVFWGVCVTAGMALGHFVINEQPLMTIESFISITIYLTFPFIYGYSSTYLKYNKLRKENSLPHKKR